MKTVGITISIANDGFYWVACDDYPALVGGGKSPEEAIEELKETLQMTKEFGKDKALCYPDWLDEDYEFSVRWNVRDLMEYYAGIITPSILGRLSGINPKQLWNYAHGVSKPRKAQIAKIEAGLHKLARDLSSIVLC